jgi:hypothetical protein
MNEQSSVRFDAGKWLRTVTVLALVFFPFTALVLYGGAVATGGGHGNYTLAFIGIGLFAANLCLFFASIVLATVYRFTSGRYSVWGLVSLAVLVALAWLLLKFW